MVARNEAIESREGTIVIKSNDYNLIAELYVIQKAFVPEITIEPESLTFAAEGGAQEVTITANFEYEVTSSADWLTLNKTLKGIEVIAEENYKQEIRTAQITIGNSYVSLVKRITIEQAACTKRIPMEFVGYIRTGSRNTYTDDNIVNEFDVWAFRNEYANTIFYSEDIIRNESLWNYSNTKYWEPNSTYFFSALAPMNSANISTVFAEGDAAKRGIGKVTYTNNGKEDLCYAHSVIDTPGIESLNKYGMEPTFMEFEHLLSIVNISFTNGFSTDNINIDIDNITITAPATATIDLTQTEYNWEEHSGETTLHLGNIKGLRANTRNRVGVYIIPADKDQIYTVKFDVSVYSGSVLAISGSITRTITNKSFERSYQYEFSINITPDLFE